MTPGEARKAENRWITRTAESVSLMLTPVLSRHRIQRLARSLSHGWVIFPKSRMVPRSVMPRFRGRHRSRGYSRSQPLPNASCSTRRYASRAKARSPAGAWPGRGLRRAQ